LPPTKRLQRNDSAERRFFAYDPAGEKHSDGAQIRQLLR